MHFGLQSHEDATWVKSAMNLAESPFILILDCTCSHRWRMLGDEGERTEIFVSVLGDCFLAHLEHYAAVWDRLATLRKTRPLNASTWGVAPRLSKTWSEKASGGAVAHQRASSAPVVARECSLSPPLWSPLRSQPRCPRVVREDERVRISAPCHVWSVSPSLGSTSFAFTSDEFGPTVVDLGWFMSGETKNCSWRREPSRGSILGNILHVMRRSGRGQTESPTVSQ